MPNTTELYTLKEFTLYILGYIDIYEFLKLYFNASWLKIINYGKYFDHCSLGYKDKERVAQKHKRDNEIFLLLRVAFLTGKTEMK